jgi:hypothetical protein
MRDKRKRSTTNDKEKKKTTMMKQEVNGPAIKVEIGYGDGEDWGFFDQREA